MAYVEKFKGYVADVPEVWFKRIDGRVFHYNQLTQASAAPQVNFTEVNAGWGLYPVAYLPAASSLEMQLTSGQFDSSMFALANGGDFEADATYKMPVTEVLKVASNLITLSSTEQIAAADVLINGMDRVTSTPAASGKYYPTSTESSGVYTTTVAFYSGDFADNAEVEVTYYVPKSNALSIESTNSKSAVGEAILMWPVYNGGESTDTTSGTFSSNDVKGYIIMDVYRARVTQVPGFDTSYKSAATNSITLATMDPENAGHGGAAYKITYVPNN